MVTLAFVLAEEGDLSTQAGGSRGWVLTANLHCPLDFFGPSYGVVGIDKITFYRKSLAQVSSSQWQ